MITKTTPTELEKRGWSRLATTAYQCGRNDIGHEFSAAGALMRQQPMDTEHYNHLMAGHAEWLNNGTFPAMTHRRKVVRAFVDAETAAYEARVRALEAEGLSRSDAQSAVEAEDYKKAGGK